MPSRNQHPKEIALSEVSEFNFDELTINIELYPNPFTDMVYIKTNHEIQKVEIKDVDGKVVFEMMVATN